MADPKKLEKPSTDHKQGGYPPAAAGKDGKKQEHKRKDATDAEYKQEDPQYTSEDFISIHYRGSGTKVSEDGCTVTISIKLEYTFVEDREFKKDYTQYCVTYKIKVTVTVHDTCRPDPDRTLTIETEHKFCDDQTDKPTGGLTQGFGATPLEGPATAGLKYPHGTKVTAEQDKEQKKITITVTKPDPPGGTVTLTIP